MKSLWILPLVLTLIASQAASPAAVCVCEAARKTNGWCDAHRVGYVGAVPIPSKMVWVTLDAHGHELDLRTFECESCKKAIESSGFCEKHRIGFVAKLAYFSRLTYLLARAEIRDGSRIDCRTCRKNAETHGWCDRCNVGMIGPFAMKEKKDFQDASEDIRILRIANKAALKCERCAVAIVTDTECPVCRISYKSGKKIDARH